MTDKFFIRYCVILPAAISFLYILSACHTALKNPSKSEAQNSDPKSTEVRFEDFQKILDPLHLIPVAGGAESLVLITLPGDKYNKLYSLAHDTKKFTLRYDAGRNITWLKSDRSKKQFYLLIDNYGDENYQIYQFDLKANDAQKIYGNDGRQVSPYLFDFSNDGQHLYFLSNHENKGLFRVYDLNVPTKTVKVLTDEKQNFFEGIADRQGKYLALGNRKGNNQIEVFILNLQNKSLEKILSKEATIYIATFFDNEGEYLYVYSDENSDRLGCAKIALNGKSKLEWVKKDDDKNLQCFYNPEANITGIESEYNGKKELSLFKGVFGDPLGIKFPPNTIVENFSTIPGTQKAVVSINASHSPTDYYQFDLSQGANAQLEKISDMNLSPFKSFAKSYDVFYESFDGLKIHGIVYAKEEWVKGNAKYPVIVWPHGGPDHKETHAYSSRFQYWVQKGFVVFAPNFRGSLGYGKKFETLNDKDWGGGHIKDIIYGKKALAQLGYIDMDNSFIVGNSFGGYSVLSAITQYPDEFRAAVGAVALANLFTFMQSIPPDPAWQGEFLSEMGDPVKDEALYRERSPYFHASQVRTPLKIYQAENDVRTVKAEMDNYVAELRKLNIPVEYVVFEGEGHGLQKAESMRTFMEGTAEFLARYKK